MLVSGDKLICKKDVANVLKEGDIVEVVTVDDERDVVSFAFGEDGMHMGIMTMDECAEYFDEYEEPELDLVSLLKNSVTSEEIKKILDNSEVCVMTMFDKCTIVAVKLPNGFVIVESSACVDPRNYDKEIGIDICLSKIESKIWELEGYKLQDSLYGHEEEYEDDKDDDECPFDCEDCDLCYYN